ncbi:MAG TPA: hypothetical protein VFR10_12685 [bacterium]|nr:hypothetical protein [bacterium]
MNEIVRRAAPWWGNFAVPQSQGAAFDVGPLEIRALRQPRQWVIAAERNLPLTDRILVRIPVDWQEPSPTASVSRVMSRATQETLRVQPVLPDRPLVVSPPPRFAIASRETVVLYVRIPVWVRLLSGDPPALLREMASVRMRDTWSGPTPKEGELGYASEEHDFPSPDELPLAPHHAVCSVRVSNRASVFLPIEEIRIPLHQLSLYSDSASRLWTSPVSLEREPDNDLAALHVSEEPPPEAQGTAQVSEPRVQVERSRIVRVFGSLLRAHREENP